jgi:rRNA-processing protein FCF1
MEYLLDTNAYCLFFQNPVSRHLPNLHNVLIKGQVLKFLIPEVVSMEIHSVLGKYRRGGNPAQHAACDRQVLSQKSVVQCSHTCVFPSQRRMSGKLFRAFQKLIEDIEHQRGPIQATVIDVGRAEFLAGKRLLLRYADRHSFGSHDALVAGTALSLAAAGRDVTLVTADKSLKSIAAQIGIQCWDPTKPAAGAGSIFAAPLSIGPISSPSPTSPPPPKSSPPPPSQTTT